MSCLKDPLMQRTLMEKWKEHYHNRNFKIKPEHGNKAGVAFFWFYTLSLMYSSLFVLIPEITKYQHKKEFRMQAFVWFIFVESLINWLLTARRWVSKVTSQKVPQDHATQENNLELKSGWKVCPTCQLVVPPRSHHCKLCQACILKRDHHCFFTGNCVGFNNQRHFIVYSFYIMVGSIFGIYLVFAYLHDPLPFYKKNSFPTYLPPVALWQWIFGYLETSIFLLLLQMYFGFITLAAAAGFFFWEMGVVAAGQTSYEVAHGIQRYRVGSVFQNFQSVFGPMWLLNFIIPLPTSQTGNGIDWETRKAVKGY